MPKYLSAQEFASASDEDRQDAVVAKGFDIEVKAGEGDDDDVFTFVVSSNSIDRDGDIVFQDGIDWKNFLKNPVILWAHNSRELPIAKGGNIRRDGEKTLMDLTFAPEEANPKAAQVKALIKGGFLNTVSIGFIPMEYAWVEDKSTGRYGLDIKRSEALEVSVVPVPSNRDALVAARKTGLSTTLLEEEMAAILKGYYLDEAGNVVAKAPPPPPAVVPPGMPPSEGFLAAIRSITVEAVAKALGREEKKVPPPPAPPAMTEEEAKSRTAVIKARLAALKASQA